MSFISVLVSVIVNGLAVKPEFKMLLNTATAAARAAGDIMTAKLGADVIKTKYNPRDLLTAGSALGTRVSCIHALTLRCSSDLVVAVARSKSTRSAKLLSLALFQPSTQHTLFLVKRMSGPEVLRLALRLPA